MPRLAFRGCLMACIIAPALAVANEAAPAGIAFFEQKVRPILVAKCYECHSAEARRLRGGLLLDSREGWQKGGDSGPAVVPGDAEESLVVQAVRYEDPALQMPPKGKLSDAEIEVLADW